MEFVASLKFVETSQLGSSCPPDQIKISCFHWHSVEQKDFFYRNQLVCSLCLIIIFFF